MVGLSRLCLPGVAVASVFPEFRRKLYVSLVLSAMLAAQHAVLRALALKFMALKVMLSRINNHYLISLFCI